MSQSKDAGFLLIVDSNVSFQLWAFIRDKSTIKVFVYKSNYAKTAKYSGISLDWIQTVVFMFLFSFKHPFRPALFLPNSHFRFMLFFPIKFPFKFSI